MKVAEMVTQAIDPIFEGFKDIKLVEVEYKKMQDGMHLVIYIDKETGVTIEDCEFVSKAVDECLDDLNPTGDETYRLDVSSYGLDKPLKHDWQLKKYINNKVNVKLYHKVDNLKEFIATLIGYNNEEYVFNKDDNNISINRASVAYITPYIEF